MNIKTTLIRAVGITCAVLIVLAAGFHWQLLSYIRASASSTHSLTTGTSRFIADAEYNKTSRDFMELPSHRNISKDSRHPVNRTKVLLMAYYRGGSSFIGQILAQNAESFYWFEPLDVVRPIVPVNTVKVKYGIKVVETDFQLLANGSLGELPQSMMEPRTVTLVKILTCRATALDKAILSGKFFRSGQGMPRFSSYKKCLRQTTQSKYEACARVLEKTCFNSTFVATKVIRYPMYEVRRLKNAIPDLKVIHYVRDPRGIVSSRADIHGWSRSKLETTARYLCLKMEANLKVFKDLQRQQPEDYMLLKYEDLALKTEQTAKLVYEFIGHDMPRSLPVWIEKNTKAKTMDWTYGTRRNAKETVYKWRRKLRGTNLQIVTDQCNGLLKELNYSL